MMNNKYIVNSVKQVIERYFVYDLQILYNPVKTRPFTISVDSPDISIVERKIPYDVDMPSELSSIVSSVFVLSSYMGMVTTPHKLLRALFHIREGLRDDAPLFSIKLSQNVKSNDKDLKDIEWEVKMFPNLDSFPTNSVLVWKGNVLDEIVSLQVDPRYFDIEALKLSMKDREKVSASMSWVMDMHTLISSVLSLPADDDTAFNLKITMSPKPYWELRYKGPSGDIEIATDKYDVIMEAIGKIERRHNVQILEDVVDADLELEKFYYTPVELNYGEE